MNITMNEPASLRAQVIDNLTPGRVIASLALFFAGSLIVDYTWKPTYPIEIPMVGHGRGFVPTIRNFFGYMSNYRNWIIDGYEKVRFLPPAVQERMLTQHSTRSMAGPSSSRPPCRAPTISSSPDPRRNG